jgi:hypothetical protein
MEQPSEEKSDGTEAQDIYTKNGRLLAMCRSKYVVESRACAPAPALRSQGCTMRASQLVERLSLVDSGDPQSERSVFCELLAFLSCLGPEMVWSLRSFATSPDAGRYKYTATTYGECKTGPPVRGTVFTRSCRLTISFSRGPRVPPNADQAAGDTSRQIAISRGFPEPINRRSSELVHSRVAAAHGGWLPGYPTTRATIIGSRMKGGWPVSGNQDVLKAEANTLSRQHQILV